MEAHAAVTRYGSQTKAAAAWGMARTTFQARLTMEKLGKPVQAPRTPAILRFPELPDPHEPIEDRIARRVEQFSRKKAHHEASIWQRIHVNETRPFGLAILGDPHLDDDGCNWPALLEDVALLRDTDGLYGINIGDTTNNWVGNLARLFANQETSQEGARLEAEWFLTKAGIRWAAILLGNHDLWNDGADIIHRMCAGAKIPVHSWQAKLEFYFPNGATFRACLAHDFKGKSALSTTHGPLKEAIAFQDGAQLYAAGHIHFGGLQQVELPSGQCPWLARARGYKEMDPHAIQNNFHEGQRFRSVMAIIDPSAPVHERVIMFPSIQQGAKVLAAMRGATLPAKRARRAPRRVAGGKTRPGRAQDSQDETTP